MILMLIIILSCTYMLSVSFLSLEPSKHLFDSITSYANHAWQDKLAQQLPSLCMQERRQTHKKKRLKGWEPEFKGTGGEAYTTSSPPPYLSLGPTHIYRNKITITLPALQTTLSCRSVWQSRRGDKIDRLISLFGQHPLKVHFQLDFVTMRL